VAPLTEATTDTSPLCYACGPVPHQTGMLGSKRIPTASAVRANATIPQPLRPILVLWAMRYVWLPTAQITMSVIHAEMPSAGKTEKTAQNSGAQRPTLRACSGKPWYRLAHDSRLAHATHKSSTKILDRDTLKSGPSTYAAV
jgi:hypothetical protein